MAVLGTRTRNRTQAHPELVDVRNREHLWLSARTLHRTLDAHLPADEEVRELLVGAVDGGRALLALTDARVVVAQEPREGGECTTIPLEEVTAVEWTRHGPTGSLAVRTRHGCCILRHVDLHRGPAVVLALQERTAALGRR